MPEMVIGVKLERKKEVLHTPSSRFSYPLKPMSTGYVRSIAGPYVHKVHIYIYIYIYIYKKG